MKVLLISANNLHAPYPVYPLGIDHVARAIGGAHDIRIADLNAVDLSRGLPTMIADFGPGVVGLSLRNVDKIDPADHRGFVAVYRHCADVVRAHTDAPLVLGGSAFTIFPTEMLKALGADFGIVGEGERMALFLDALAAGRDPRQIAGVIASGDNGPLPVPWQGPFGSAFRENARHLGFYLEHGAILNLQSKRGCPFQCIYCTYPHIEGNRLRLIPPAEVARTALTLQRAGAKFLFVTDSSFNADYDHSAAVARAFQAAGVSVPWGAFFSPTPPPANYYRRLADAGLSHVEFGTESLSDRILTAYRKPFRMRHVMVSHQAAVKAGLYVAHFFLLGGPGEDPTTLEETLSQVDKLAKSVLFFFCGMRIYPNTTLYRMALESGQISREQSLLAPVFYRPDAIGFEEIVSVVEERAAGRLNWVVGAGGEKTAGIIATMHGRGFSGPLWEYLIR